MDRWTGLAPSASKWRAPTRGYRDPVSAVSRTVSKNLGSQGRLGGGWPGLGCGASNHALPVPTPGLIWGYEALSAH